ncbi:MAG TPA: isocitrate lyase/phosphoenolpyruvate mutase family protein [Gemmatimonadaceae bacterium]|nr:isocitrate lyase/phosphoenolpyruvate mutase family protein [Gemmatimonadaceae bacterium]
MEIAAQRQRAQDLLALHQPGNPVVLINVWDVVSARLIERTGARAIATTSAGIAWALGYPDGERIPREEMLGVVERIARAVSVPVTADLEAGYGPRASDVAETVRLAIGAGAVGMNLEDCIEQRGGGAERLLPIDAATERVAAARAAAGATSIPFVINARTDVFLRNVGDPAARLGHAVERANAYRAAGADSLFVPGVRDAETIGALAKEIDGPLNVVVGPGTPSLGELGRLGVARISLGAGAMRAALGTLVRATTALAETGTFDAFVSGALGSVDLNDLMGTLTKN